LGKQKQQLRQHQICYQNIRHHKVLSKHQKWQHCCISSTCAH